MWAHTRHARVKNVRLLQKSPRELNIELPGDFSYSTAIVTAKTFRYEDYNVVVTMFSSDDNYAQNLISGDGVTEKYKREDLSQVNPQLYKWLAIINDKSSTGSRVSQDADIVNSSVHKIASIKK